MRKRKEKGQRSLDKGGIGSREQWMTLVTLRELAASVLLLTLDTIPSVVIRPTAVNVAPTKFQSHR